MRGDPSPEIRFADEPPAASGDLLARINLDTPLLLALLSTSALGLMILYSAGSADSDLVLRQAIRLGLGFGLMTLLAQVSPPYLRMWTPWLFLGGLLLLVGVLIIGVIGKGAQRWLDLGVVRFQPSEIMKVAVPMMMSWYLADKPLPLRLRHLGVGLLIAAVPFVLIVKQPDLGTALLVASSGLFVLFLGGLSWAIILGFTAITAAVAPLFWNYAMHDYQRQRVLTFLNPESDPLGTGYHIIQSKIAIGSGGLYGKGWLNGTQSHLEFLPESHTDFILGAFAEEFGLIGMSVLLILYFFIIARSLYLAARAPDNYSRLLGGSLALTFFVYVFINSGMVCGLLPVVGLPLPLVSYGGTSLVTVMAGFGMLMSVYSHRRRLSY